MRSVRKATHVREVFGQTPDPPSNFPEIVEKISPTYDILSSAFWGDPGPGFSTFAGADGVTPINIVKQTTGDQLKRFWDVRLLWIAHDDPTARNLVCYLVSPDGLILIPVAQVSSAGPGTWYPSVGRFVLPVGNWSLRVEANALLGTAHLFLREMHLALLPGEYSTV